MKRFYIYLLILTLCASFNMYAQQTFKRKHIVPAPKSASGGLGNIVSGVDLDKDGWPEIYMVNNNVYDDTDTIPRIYKYEYNGVSWDSVWSAIPDVPYQNTWPALVAADLDKDGKGEIIWTPVNAIDPVTNPNPNRIVVYEATPGKEYMGIDDGFGGYLPNAKTTIVTEPNVNLRPIRAVIKDIDKDGKEEIVLSDRASSPVYNFVVMGVSDIPDNGNGSEKWTLKASAKGNTTMGTSVKYDVNVMNNFIYSFAANGKVYPIKYANNAYEIRPVLNNVAGEGASWISSQVADIDKDGVEEMVVGEYDNTTKGTAIIWLVQKAGDTLKSTPLVDLKKMGVLRIMGSAQGDLDGDGMKDFVFGSRYNDKDPKKNNAVIRLQYLGGDITNPKNYKTAIIDSMFYTTGGDLSLINIGNFDSDKDDEVAYSCGYPRGFPGGVDSLMGVIVLDRIVASSVERTGQSVESFYLGQNYPNPFNPSTTIKFGLVRDADVSLKIYDILGNEVATLLNSSRVKAGEYEVKFDASKLASGVYIYSLKSGKNTLTNKMILMK